MANWDESKHPRDDDGKFGSGGGGSVDDVIKSFSDEPEFAQGIKDGIKDGVYSKDPEKLRKQLKDDMDEDLQAKKRSDLLDATFNRAGNMANLILNSVQTIEGDAPLSVQLAPFGEFKGVLNKADGKKTPIVQHLDQAAFERILNAWKAAGSPELLVDADHLSCEGGSTKAFAWASNLRIEDGGLYADFRFTEAGRAAVNAREYRFVSPVFNCDENGEAVGLQSVALTNRPNLPVACVLNSSESGVNNVEEEKEHPEMDEIKTLLGLGADATPEDVANAVKALQQKVADSEAAALNAEAEKFADNNKDRIENRKAVVDLYVKNGKDVAEAFLAAFKAPEKAPEKPAQTVLNSKTDVTPGTVTPLRAGLAKCKNAAERAAYVTAHAAEFAAEGK